ncbi:MAG TPA: glycosyltransferase family 39 protein [Pyrinomonadaceae bacterium]|nr:glycosyltransferase family 39 protein [Pyrinomonadaceae bacterium]
MKKTQPIDNVQPPTTAGIFPEKFADELAFLTNRHVAALILTILIVVGFGLRVNKLGAESLSEDEFNKLQTVEEYRTNGLSGKNGEHPFLMKGLQTVSVIAAERISPAITPEAALRFPLALFGTFTTLLLYFLFRELFGRSIALVTAALWAVEPIAVSFDRIAKEDSLVLFFFLLTSICWVRSQTLAERGASNWIGYVWGMGVSFAALMASKYYPWLLSIIGGYYNVFEYIPLRKWRVGMGRWLIFFIVMGTAFLLFNPTILLPETWREMAKFSSEGRVGHDSYEFMGQLYSHKMSAWLAGVPWTFYYVFIAVKSSLSTLILFLIGIPLLFKKRLGDGRFYVALWAFLWFMPYTVLGGKFTRYFAVAEPLVLLGAAVAFYFGVKWLSDRLQLPGLASALLQSTLFAILIGIPLYDTLSATPHVRMFTNALGGGMSAAGRYFPHDEFYDAASADIVSDIAQITSPGATVACETPELLAYYQQKARTADLKFVSLSDKQAVTELKEGDVIVLTTGRRYFSNMAYEQAFNGSLPAADVRIAGATAARLYKLDAAKMQTIRDIANR